MLDGENKRLIADMVRCNLLFNTLQDRSAGAAILSRYEANLGAIHYDDVGAGRVNWTLVYGQDTMFFFAGGVNDNAARTGILDGWSRLSDLTQSDGFNYWAWNIAKTGPYVYFRPDQIGNRQLIFCGHSGGGVVMEALNFLLTGRDVRPNDITILTGTPRGLAFDYPGFYTAGKITRFMNVGDPIPILPPRMREWPEFCILGCGLSFPAQFSNVFQSASPSAALPVFSVWPGFHHPPGGLMLNDSGFSLPRHDVVVQRSDNPLNGSLLAGFDRISGLPEHQMSTYVNNVETWALLNSPYKKTSSPEAPGETSSGDWGPSIQFFCPQDDFGRIVPSPQGRVQVMGNILQTGTIPGQDGSVQGAIYLRGQLVAIFPTRGKAKTAASRLNRFLSRLPYATEVSTTGLVDGMQQYLVEAAIGGGVDRRPVKVVT